MTNWHEARSSAVEKPRELDTTSSGAVVYERRNIRQDARDEHGQRHAERYRVGF